MDRGWKKNKIAKNKYIYIYEIWDVYVRFLLRARVTSSSKWTAGTGLDSPRRPRHQQWCK
jgi:hypothetical protein